MKINHRQPRSIGCGFAALCLRIERTGFILQTTASQNHDIERWQTLRSLVGTLVVISLGNLGGYIRRSRKYSLKGWSSVIWIAESGLRILEREISFDKTSPM